MLLEMEKEKAAFQRKFMSLIIQSDNWARTFSVIKKAFQSKINRPLSNGSRGGGLQVNKFEHIRV